MQTVSCANSLFSRQSVVLEVGYVGSILCNHPVLLAVSCVGSKLCGQ